MLVTKPSIDDRSQKLLSTRRSRAKCLFLSAVIQIIIKTQKAYKDQESVFYAIFLITSWFFKLLKMGGAGLVPLTNAQQAATFTILLINGVLIAILLTLSIVLLPLLLFIGPRILHGRRNRNRDTQTIESGSVACCAACVNAQNISQGFQSVPGRGFSSNAGAGIFTAPAQSARNSPRVPRNNFSERSIKPEHSQRSLF